MGRSSCADKPDSCHLSATGALHEELWVNVRKVLNY